MEIIIGVIILVAIGVYLWKQAEKRKVKKQLAYIENYTFSPAIFKRVHEKHKYLNKQGLKKVEGALRDYFYICSLANGKMVAMPSEIVDVAWHEFILFTREYEHFCKNAMGRFLHHTPTEAMVNPTSAQGGIKRAWRLACSKAKVDPNKPKKLPQLFSIDKTLKIRGGFTYNLNCKGKGKGTNSGYCATHIGCASGCSSESDYSSESSSNSSSDGEGWFGSSDSNSSCGGSSSSSCGGGGGD